MLKVQILSTCSHCKGEAYLLIGMGKILQGRRYTRLLSKLKAKPLHHPHIWQVEVSLPPPVLGGEGGI